MFSSYRPRHFSHKEQEKQKMFSSYRPRHFSHGEQKKQKIFMI